MIFEKTEFLKRLDNTKKAMEKREIDILITSNPANMNYLSGYDGYSFYIIQGVIVLFAEPEPIWIGRKMDVPGAEFSTWLAPENIIGYEDDYVQSNTKHPMHFFADVLREKGVRNNRIGLEMAQDSLSVTSFNELQKKLPDCQWKDASYLINHVRMIKSDREIHYMKLAGKITSHAMQTAFDSIHEGVEESEVAAQIYQSLIKGTEEQTGDYPAIIPLMSSGEKIAAPHLSWSKNDYKKNDIVTLELSGCVHRYHAPLARTVYIGTPTQKYLNTVNTVLEGLHEMLHVIKAGITCDEVAASWNKVLAKSAITKDSRVGYPIGIGYPPDWGEQTISIRPGDNSILQSNMALHLLPALFQADTGFVVSESIRVTEEGCELLTNLSQNLVLK